VRITFYYAMEEKLALPGFLQVNVTSTNQEVLRGAFHNVETGNIVDQFVVTKSKTQ